MAKLTFEQKIAKIDEIIEKLESSSSTLDESVKLYNEGTTLAEECQNELADARLKITKIGNKSESE